MAHTVKLTQAELTDANVVPLSSTSRRKRVKSQKANALFRLDGRTSWKTPNTIPLLLDDHIRVVERTIATQINNAKTYHAFIRACPVNPRHGVLESAPASSIREGVEIYERIRDTMLELEPDGCMIVMPFVEAKASAVVAPQQYIVMGPSHDGVTAGHGFQMALPLDTERAKANMTYHWINDVGGEVDKMQLEFVYDGQRSYLVQARGCGGNPPLGNAKVSVNGQPSIIGTMPGKKNGDTILVTEVFTLPDENPEWIAKLEAKVHGPMPEGFVVCMPTGSLLGHPCAHSFENGVPFIVGEVAEGDVVACINDYDPNDYAEAFFLGCEYARVAWAPEWGWLSNIFHQFVADPYMDYGSCAFLAGCYVGWLITAGSAALIAESRHAHGQMQGYTPRIAAALSLFSATAKDSIPYFDEPQDAVDAMDQIRKRFKSPSSQRQQYYDMFRNTHVPWEDLRASALWAEKVYSHPWGSSYGGEAWAECSRLIADIVPFMIKGDLKGAIGAANKAEHAAHNNGWLYNKFIPQQALDFGTRGYELRGDYINRAFETYTLCTELLTAYDDPDSWVTFHLNVPYIPWAPALEDDKFIMGIKEMLSAKHWGWEEGNKSFQSCPKGDGCTWCSGHEYHAHMELMATVKESGFSVLPEEHTHPSSSHDGWFAGTEVTPAAIKAKSKPWESGQSITKLSTSTYGGQTSHVIKVHQGIKYKVPTNLTVKNESALTTNNMMFSTVFPHSTDKEYHTPIMHAVINHIQHGFGAAKKKKILKFQVATDKAWVNFCAAMDYGLSTGDWNFPGAKDVLNALWSTISISGWYGGHGYGPSNLIQEVEKSIGDGWAMDGSVSTLSEEAWIAIMDNNKLFKMWLNWKEQTSALWTYMADITVTEVN